MTSKAKLVIREVKAPVPVSLEVPRPLKISGFQAFLGCWMLVLSFGLVSDPARADLFDYDALGRLTCAVYGSNLTPVYSSGKLVCSGYPLATIIEYEYDAAGNRTTKTVSVYEGPYDVTFSATLSVPENSPVGTTVVATASAVNTDSGLDADDHYYYLENVEGNRYVIDQVTGVISLNAALNYEADTSTSLNIKVVEILDPTAEYTKAINIATSDVNEAPIVAALGTLTPKEDSEDRHSFYGGGEVPNDLDQWDAIATLSGTDPDAGDTIVEYQILSAGNPNGAWGVSVSNQIVANNLAAIDYEINPTFSLQIRAKDNHGLWGPAQTVQVNLQDLADHEVMIYAMDVGSSPQGVIYTSANDSALHPPYHTKTYSVYNHGSWYNSYTWKVFYPNSGWLVMEARDDNWTTELDYFYLHPSYRLIGWPTGFGLMILS